MILWTTALMPLCLGGLIWLLGSWLGGEGKSRRKWLGGATALVLLAEFVCALTAAINGGSSSLSWGRELALTLTIIPMVQVAIVLVPLIALPVVIWASAAEAEAGLPRLLGLLVAFTGSMELLVLAEDLLTVAIAWELLGMFSWVLIAHHWQEEEKVSAANYAFNATRLGGLGIWFAAAAALAVGGSFDFKTLSAVAGGSLANWMAAGIFVAAAAKSAQGPFAAWLFRAMEGPSSVSALLHSSTMVAAGAWLLIRLHEPLASLAWFGPAAIALGLTTAIAGGFSAIAQPDAKRLLAASTSAQYGLMFVAVGAGYSAAGLAHLVTHAAFKALLFLAAGSAIGLTGSHALARMRLGRRLPVIAAAGWVGALGLAAIPPLGAAWSKEKIVTAAGHISPWLAILTIIAGTLSAWYAMRFQTLAYGRSSEEKLRDGEEGNAGEQAGVWLLAAWSVFLGLLWFIGENKSITHLLGELPVQMQDQSWELPLSIGAAVGAAVISWLVYSHPKAGSKRSAASKSAIAAAADWWGLPGLIDALVIEPTYALSRFCAAFDRRVVDAGVRAAVAFVQFISESFARLLEFRLDQYIEGSAGVGLWLAEYFRKLIESAIDSVVDRFGSGTSSAGTRSRRIQTGAVPTYLAYLAGGFVLFFLTFIIGI